MSFVFVRRLHVLLCCLGMVMGGHAGVAQAQTVLTVAAFPAVDEIVKAALPAWQKLHPEVQVHVVSRQFSDHHTAMTTALSTSSHLPDIMALEVGYLGRFSQGRGLDNLAQPPYLAGRFAPLFVPYAIAQSTKANGAITALPTDIGPGTLLYRQDILTRAGVSEAQLTQSWESYVQAGVQIKAKTGAYLLAHARELKDIMIRSAIASGDGIYFDAQGKVTVNTPRFRRAFALAREVRQHKLDAKVSAWSNEWAEGFRRGSVVTQMSGAWLAGHMNNWLAPQTRGLWRAAQLPEGAYAAFGGSFLALPRAASAKHKALAWELVQLVALNPDLQRQAFAQHDAFPSLLATHQDAFFKQPVAFLGEQPARLLWRDAAQKIKAVGIHKQDAFADEVINTELDKVLDLGKDIDQALRDAEDLLARRAKR